MHPHAQTRLGSAFISLIAFLTTGCPLTSDDASLQSTGSETDPYEADAEEQCEDLAYWLCGHGEPCLNDIPVDECTDAVIRDLHCWNAVGVKPSYEVCGREIVDWDCRASDAPVSCQDAIVYSGDEPNDSDNGKGDTADSEGTDTETDSSNPEAQCEYLYTSICERIALCAAQEMGDLSLFTGLRNQCIEVSEPQYQCTDAVGTTTDYPACLLAIEYIDCNAEEQTLNECENVILYE